MKRTPDSAQAPTIAAKTGATTALLAVALPIFGAALILTAASSPASAVMGGAPTWTCGGDTWDLIYNIGSGVHSYQVYQKRQTAWEVLNNEDIWISVGWDHQVDTTELLQGIKVDRIHYGYDPWLGWGWKHELEEYFLDQDHYANPCTGGIIRNSYTSYNGPIVHFDVEASMDKSVVTEMDSSSYTVSHTIETTTTRTASVSAKFSPTLMGSGTEVSYSESRGYGESNSLAHESGASVSTVGTLWVGHVIFDVGGSGITAWAEALAEAAGVPVPGSEWLCETTDGDFDTFTVAAISTDEASQFNAWRLLSESGEARIGWAPAITAGLPNFFEVDAATGANAFSSGLLATNTCGALVLAAQDASTLVSLAFTVGTVENLLAADGVETLTLGGSPSALSQGATLGLSGTTDEGGAIERTYDLGADTAGVISDDAVSFTYQTVTTAALV